MQQASKAMSTMVRSLNSWSVVRFNVWAQLCMLWDTFLLAALVYVLPLPGLANLPIDALDGTILNCRLQKNKLSDN